MKNVPNEMIDSEWQLRINELGMTTEDQCLELINNLFATFSLESKRRAFYNIKNALKDAQKKADDELYKDLPH